MSITLLIILASQTFTPDNHICGLTTDTRTFVADDAAVTRCPASTNPFWNYPGTFNDGEELSTTEFRRFGDRLCSVWSRATNGAKYCEVRTSGFGGGVFPNTISAYTVIDWPTALGVAAPGIGSECDIAYHCRDGSSWPDNGQVSWDTSFPESNHISFPRDGRSTDFWGTGLHEVGHSLGLSHPFSGDLCDHDIDCEFPVGGDPDSDCADFGKYERSCLVTSVNGNTNEGKCRQSSSDITEVLDCPVMSSTSHRISTWPNQLDIRNIVESRDVVIETGTLLADHRFQIVADCDLGVNSFTPPRITCPVNDSSSPDCYVSYRPSLNNGPVISRVNVVNGSNSCTIHDSIQSTWMSDGPVDLASSAFVSPWSTVRHIVGVGKRTVRANFLNTAHVITYGTTPSLNSVSVTFLEDWFYSGSPYPQVDGECPDVVTSDEGGECVWEKGSAMTHTEPRISYVRGANRFLVVYPDLSGDVMAVSVDTAGRPTTTSGAPANLPTPLGFNSTQFNSMTPVQAICDDHVTNGSSSCSVYFWEFNNGNQHSGARVTRVRLSISGSEITILGVSNDSMRHALLVDGFRLPSGRYVLDVDALSEEFRSAYRLVNSSNAYFSPSDIKTEGGPFLKGNTTSVDYHEQSARIIVVGSDL